MTDWACIRDNPEKLEARRESQRTPQYRARRRSQEYRERRRKREASPEFRAARRAYRIGRGEYGEWDGPVPVRDWENCQSCGHLGADCDCTCCWPDVDEEADYDDGV